MIKKTTIGLIAALWLAGAAFAADPVPVSHIGGLPTSGYHFIESDIIDIIGGAWIIPDADTISQAGWSLHAVDSASPSYPAGNAFDGDINTIWHTQWGPAPPQPHTIDIDLGQTYWISRLDYTPRQDLENGRINTYELYVSTDGATWGQAVASGSWPNSAAVQTVLFSPVQGRYFRLRSTISSYGPNPDLTSVAEINLIGW